MVLESLILVEVVRRTLSFGLQGLSVGDLVATGFGLMCRIVTAKDSKCVDGGTKMYCTGGVRVYRGRGIGLS